MLRRAKLSCTSQSPTPAVTHARIAADTEAVSGMLALRGAAERASAAMVAPRAPALIRRQPVGQVFLDQVFPVVQHLQIFRPVIRADAVLVVHDLSRQESAADLLLSDQVAALNVAVGVCLGVVGRKHPHVSSLRDIAPTLPIGVALPSPPYRNALSPCVGGKPGRRDSLTHARSRHSFPSGARTATGSAGQARLAAIGTHSSRSHLTMIPQGVYRCLPS